MSIPIGTYESNEMKELTTNRVNYLIKHRRKRNGFSPQNGHNIITFNPA